MCSRCQVCDGRGLRDHFIPSAKRQRGEFTSGGRSPSLALRVPVSSHQPLTTDHSTYPARSSSSTRRIVSSRLIDVSATLSEESFVIQVSIFFFAEITVL